jgi:RNA ligase
MVYFPRLETIDPVLEAIKGMDEIKVNEFPEHGYGVVMYMVAFEETFNDPFSTKNADERARRLLRRECRGIKYDLVTRRIISRPYHKFFNINEKLETQLNKIDWSLPHVVLEKLDGSMLTPFLNPTMDKMFWMTKRGVTEISLKASGFFETHPHYEKFCRAMIADDLTPIFEWCTRTQRIIIDYGPVDRMVLTAVRDNVTGEYMRYDAMVALADQWNLDCVKTVDLQTADPNAFVEHVRDLKNEEGYIVRFDDGRMFKIKGEWYCRIHKTMDVLKWEKDVLTLILKEEIDDAKPFLSESMRLAVDRYQADVIKAMMSRAEDIYWYVVASRDNLNGSKKKFVEQTMASSWANLFGVVFSAWDHNKSVQEIYEEMVKNVLFHSVTQSRVNTVRHYFGGHNWNDYLRYEQPIE